MGSMGVTSVSGVAFRSCVGKKPEAGARGRN